MIDGSRREECDPVELSPADAGACLQLSIAAGWNQTAEDWWMMLTAARGFGFRAGETLVATALFLPYRFSVGWIAMVLVDAEYRRRGLASALLQRCIDAAASPGVTAMLDATADGREVYSRMGFIEGPRITRFLSPGVTGGTLHDRPATYAAFSETSIQPLTRAKHRDVVRLDGEVVGSSRDVVLSDIMHRAADRCVVLVDAGGAVKGYALGRPGRIANHIGPVVAPGLTDAIALVRHLIDRSTGSIIIDVPDMHEALQTELIESGFRPQRSLVRMARTSPNQTSPGAAANTATTAAATAATNAAAGFGFPDMTRMFAIGGPAIG